MILKTPALRLSFAIVGCVASQPAIACPYCNIHYLLGQSVEVAEDIYVGEVVGQTRDGTAEIKVLKVLRGGHQIGSTVSCHIYQAKQYIGQQYIFCERSSRLAQFGRLPLDREDEVLFLMQGRPYPAPRDMDEAFRRLRGLSKESQQAGLDYVASHHAAAVDPLLAEINSILPADLSMAEQFSGEYPLAHMTEALLLEPTEKGRDFVFGQIDAYPTRPASPHGWNIWPLLIPAAIGGALLLTGMSWFGTGLFLRWQFPRSLWALAALMILTTVLTWCATWYSLLLYRWDVSLLFIPSIIGMSICLVGILWFSTRVFFHRPFPRTIRSLLICVPAAGIVLYCAAWYVLPRFRCGMQFRLLFSAFGTSLLAVACLGLTSRRFLSRPFPGSLWSWLVLASLTTGLIVFSAWYAHPVPRRITADGIFLRDMLRSATKDAEFAAMVKERLLARCETLDGLPLAEAVYAMSLSNIASPDEIEARLLDQESADMLALGVFLAGNHESLWWQHERARPFLDRANRLAQSQRLKAAISRSIEFSDRWRH